MEDTQEEWKALISLPTYKDTRRYFKVQFHKNNVVTSNSLLLTREYMIEKDMNSLPGALDAAMTAILRTIAGCCG